MIPDLTQFTLSWWCIWKGVWIYKIPFLTLVCQWSKLVNPVCLAILPVAKGSGWGFISFSESNEKHKQLHLGFELSLSMISMMLCAPPYIYNVVYQAIIYPKEDINNKKYYIGVLSTNWKIRYGNHKFSFSHEQKNQTALSKHYWGLKNKGLTPDIQWSILKKSNAPKSFDNRCNLCLEEKIHILLFSEPKKLLNKRNELIARCRHRAKFKL